MDLVFKLLRKNTSPTRLAGFLVSNLIGLAIIGAGLQFYLDARSIWQREDSFLKSDYLAINKIIDASHTLGGASAEFSQAEIADLRNQPWVKRVGAFSRAAFGVHAAVALDGAPGAGGRSMSTAMFFEAVPEGFLDVADGSFTWQEGDTDVPLIISKDYLALYNFGFANSAGLPKLSESLISGIPLRLDLISEDGSRRERLTGHVAGYSNRFNTILVPENFLRRMNETLGSGGTEPAPSRLIVDVSSPGDTAIARYLKEKGWEVAGDKSAASATYMLKVVSGIVMAIGSVITVLSVLILLLSMSLLMEKNRRQLHSLLMLGYKIRTVARPYWRITAIMSLAAGALAFVAVVLLRLYYLQPLRGMGGAPSGLWGTAGLLLLLTVIVILLNCVSITRRVRGAWR
ncbi:MAG: ABC transporter permease [Muribaculaceae bacterium]|nr:ABC transporter permease [Muribaculaceae bacterium]